MVINFFPDSALAYETLFKCSEPSHLIINILSKTWLNLCDLVGVNIVNVSKVYK